MMENKFVVASERPTVLVQEEATHLRVLAERTAITPTAPGPQGLPGSQGGGYTYERTVPASTWIVEHNLHKYPNVQFFTDDGELQECDVFINSLESMTLVFDEPTTGKAVFS